MATIELKDDAVLVQMHGLDKFWGWTSTLTVPLAHVESVGLERCGALLESVGFLDKRVGTLWPGKFAMGTINVGEHVYWVDLHHPEAMALVLSCSHEKFKKVVVEVQGQDANALVTTIEATLSRSRTG